MKKFSKVLALCLVTVFAALSLVACAPNSDPEKAVANLKDADYVAVRATDAVTLTVTEVLLGCSRGDIVAIVTGTKVGEDKTDTVTVIYFKEASVANNVWNKAQSEYSKKDSDEDSDWVVSKSGKMIYYGTKDGVKATY